MNISITPETTLERETSLNQKVKKKLTCNLSYYTLLILSNFGFYFCKIFRNLKKSPNTMIYSGVRNELVFGGRSHIFGHRNFVTFKYVSYGSERHSVGAHLNL